MAIQKSSLYFWLVFVGVGASLLAPKSSKAEPYDLDYARTYHTLPAGIVYDRVEYSGRRAGSAVRTSNYSSGNCGQYYAATAARYAYTQPRRVVIQHAVPTETVYYSSPVYTHSPSRHYYRSGHHYGQRRSNFARSHRFRSHRRHAYSHHGRRHHTDRHYRGYRSRRGHHSRRSLGFSIGHHGRSHSGFSFHYGR